MAALQSGERSKVQELYEACTMVFAGEGGPKPAEDEIRWLQDLLGTMEAADVGIAGYDDGDRVREITYIHIYQCEEFSMGIFCFPEGGKLPLHDHPEMVVLSKVLYGSVSVKAYDWVREPNPSPRYKKCGLATLAMDGRVLQASSSAVALFPRSGGNIHSFTALTPCAILDVLSPPYAENRGRQSTYYSDIHIPSLPGFAMLVGAGVPRDLTVRSAPYLGPDLLLDEGDYDDDFC